MAFVIRLGKDAADEVRRVACEQAGKAINELTGADADRHEAVHDARKRLKKIRGLLRLTRKPLGNRYPIENAFYRDTARLLSEARDAQAIFECFQSLFEKSNCFDEVRRILETERDRLTERTDRLDAAAKQAVSRLREGIQRIDDWPLKKDAGFSLFEQGLRETYSRGKAAFRKAAESPTDENLHDWRKRVKYLWYQHRLLKRLWPAVMKGYVSELGRLSDLLGDDHDLAVLAAKLQSDDFARLPDAVDKAGQKIAKRRGDLQSEANALGALIYAESPKRMAARFRKLWTSRAKSEAP